MIFRQHDIHHARRPVNTAARGAEAGSRSLAVAAEADKRGVGRRGDGEGARCGVPTELLIEPFICHLYVVRTVSSIIHGVIHHKTGECQLLRTKGRRDHPHLSMIVRT